ncbi:MAG TPA: nuclear transport factor 2 family protein, partial [Pyrinomonadaceae bacterium]
MKRLLALTALLLAASACTTTTDTNKGAGSGNANANANTAAASPTPAAGPTQADLEARERAAYDAMKAKNWDAFAALLADDFVAVGSDGTHNKAETVEYLKKYDLTEYTLSDVRFLKVDADLALLTYTMTDKSTYEGKPSPGKPVRSSSAWVNRGGKWLNVYHQESEVAEAAAPSPTPATSASPAA